MSDEPDGLARYDDSDALGDAVMDGILVFFLGPPEDFDPAALEAVIAEAVGEPAPAEVER